MTNAYDDLTKPGGPADPWKNVCISDPEDEDSWIEHGEFKDLFKEWQINK